MRTFQRREHCSGGAAGELGPLIANGVLRTSEKCVKLSAKLFLLLAADVCVQWLEALEFARALAAPF
jgi:hypothetical protein